MEYHVLASGSKGNSIFIYDKDEGLLIDCGISRKQLLYKLDSLGFKERDIRHVLLTHDHYDHNKNIGIFDQKIVYSGKNCIPHLDETHVLKPYQDIDLDHFRITPLPLSHDATSPLGFVIKGYQETILYMTDTGYVSQKNMKYIDNLDYYIFESNHDGEMLMNGKYPEWLKKRVVGPKGHLSNRDSSIYLSKLIGSNTQKIILAHLSKENNTEEEALKTINEVFNEYQIPFINIECAKQREKTKVVTI